MPRALTAQERERFNAIRPAHNEQYEALQAEWTAIIKEERAKRNGLFGEVHHPAFREVRGDA